MAHPSVLDRAGADIAIQSLTLQNEGWEREENIKPPEEPDFNLPDVRKNHLQ